MGMQWPEVIEELSVTQANCQLEGERSGDEFEPSRGLSNQTQAEATQVTVV
jgi:hypothetical protein